jgi:hypothetical protein
MASAQVNGYHVSGIFEAWGQLVLKKTCMAPKTWKALRGTNSPHSKVIYTVLKTERAL